MLQALSREYLRQRHWQEVIRITGCQLALETGQFKLQALLDTELLNHKEEIEYITEAAEKQQQIEQKLNEIKEKWASEVFSFVSWRDRPAPVLHAYGGIMEALEESQLTLQTMLSMRHIAPFKDEVQSKLSQLSDTSDILEQWIKVQLLWCSLESVFTSGDVAKQMPTEAKKFAKIDKDWTRVMQKAEETSNAVICCANDVLKNTLPILYTELERCQKSLDNYLEQKRGKFPRFYFVADSVLLQILSQGSDPTSAQPYYEKIFESIDKVVHNDKDRHIITHIKSISGGDEEIVTLINPVRATDGIEDWLGELEKEMQRTMKVICGDAARDCSEMADEDLRDFVNRYCGQFALLGLQLKWTADCEYALETCKQSKGIMAETHKKLTAQLAMLSSWTLDDLGSQMNRVKVEAMITVQVHQRDVFADLVKLFKDRRISGPSDFEWLKQCRFYWKPREEDLVDSKGACVVSICDSNFKYSYEYLGCKERLVITPLTDRCYITLSQALHMHLGGAPVGPAGTGKTETTKDLGRALGLYVVVTNCTDQQRFSDMAKIFKGLCQAGVWGCFDEFNRIELPVLSVVAQQVLAITNAKRSHATSFLFPGETHSIPLRQTVGYFITMNPSYAGRQELPENLKVLFRSVAMMVPNREIIMKVRLCSVGYANFSELARKFQTCYQLCEQQLSQQKHYDFGLRNILSVLRSAGQIKRENIAENDNVLLFRTLRDMNLAKLVAQDVPIFLSLLRDLFPAVSNPPKSEYPAIQRCILQSVADSGLIAHPTWITDVIQLYETCQVRHGLAVLGPPGAGKTQIMSTLSDALSRHSGVQYRIVRMFPKVIIPSLLPSLLPPLLLHSLLFHSLPPLFIYFIYI